MSEATPAAYGGAGWTARAGTLRDELGGVWAACGLRNEWEPLRAVLLHTPGPEWDDLADADSALMLARPDPALARSQHQALAALYRRLGVAVAWIEPSQTPPPNLLFAADLFAMTPSGAVVGRPASAARAGEERWVARRLADLGVPILRTVAGRGAFEGADLIWLTENAALLGIGLRTNAAGADQLALLDAGLTRTPLPAGTMHLMGQLRILDRDLAVYWPGRLDSGAVELLGRHGYEAHAIPDEIEAAQRGSLNVVTLGPREIIMPADCPQTRRFYERLGVVCHEADVSELLKAAGGIACMTGILRRAAWSAS